MKRSHRRNILRDLASLLAMPLAFRLTDEPLPDDNAPRPSRGARSIRPRIAAPKESVMRRG